MSPVSQGRLDFPVRKLRSSTRNTPTKKILTEDEGGENENVPPAPSTPKSNRRKFSRKVQLSGLPPTSPNKVNKKESHRSPLKSLQPPNSPLKSPTSALRNISLNASPIAKEEQRKSPRKKLEVNLVSPVSPRKRQLFKPDTSRYSEARAALSTAALPEGLNLIGREKQLQEMQAFLNGNVKKSLYVSGAPGTGKTACLTYLLNTGNHGFHKSIFVNCMSLKSPAAVFNKVAKELGSEKYLKERDAKKFIEESISGKMSEKVLLVLDEIDQLDSKAQEILYTIFEWPHLHGSTMMLVGIANALDLTDRILPRLKLRKSICPDQLSFPAYNREEINNIITIRLKELNNGDNPIIKPVAIKFLAGKISAISGDIRKALDVCRRAVELAEIAAKKQMLLKTGDNNAIKPIELPQILKIFNEVYGSRVATSLKDSDAVLPLVQKLLLASLLLMTKDRCKEVPLTKLYQTYVKVCKKRNMTAVSESECVSLVSLLESRGLLGSRQSAKQEPRNAKISLRIDENEVETALADKTLLSDILKDVSCIAK